MTIAEILQELESLVPSDRAEVIRQALNNLYPQNSKVIDRLLHRLANPDVPEAVWRKLETEEDSAGAESGTASTQRFFRPS